MFYIAYVLHKHVDAMKTEQINCMCVVLPSCDVTTHTNTPRSERQGCQVCVTKLRFYCFEMYGNLD